MEVTIKLVVDVELTKLVIEIVFVTLVFEWSGDEKIILVFDDCVELLHVEDIVAKNIVPMFLFPVLFK